jgi:hypothetical protein
MTIQGAMLGVMLQFFTKEAKLITGKKAKVNYFSLFYCLCNFGTIVPRLFSPVNKSGHVAIFFD